MKWPTKLPTSELMQPPTEKPVVNAPFTATDVHTHSIFVPTSGVSVPIIPTQVCTYTLNKSTDIDYSATLYYALVPFNPPRSDNGICECLKAEN